MFLGGQAQPRPFPRGWAQAYPSPPRQKNGPLTFAHTVGERATKFCTVIKRDASESFTGPTTSLPAQKNCATMLTRGVLAVANLVIPCEHSPVLS